jgi:cobalt/nickel transport system ATP-binding protein
MGLMQHTWAVEIKDLIFGYEKDRPVLDSISLNIPKGDRFAVIGPSGAGKSTLLLHLNGILRGQGTVKIEGQTVKKNTLADVRQKVGLVFQNPDDQLFHPTVEEDIAFGPLNMGLDRKEVRRRVAKVLDQMNLKGFERKTSHHLSYGERKRVALATVLAMEPEIIAFDEPFSNLDPGMVQQLVEIIGALKGTVILVSQEILPAVACCRNLAVIKKGKIEAVGPSMEIASNKALLKSCSLDLSLYCTVCESLKS